MEWRERLVRLSYVPSLNFRSFSLVAVEKVYSLDSDAYSSQYFRLSKTLRTSHTILDPLKLIKRW
jgi:hypothetical protein